MGFVLVGQMSFRSNGPFYTIGVFGIMGHWNNEQSFCGGLIGQAFWLKSPNLYKTVLPEKPVSSGALETSSSEGHSHK